jgi:hypothetical protein
MNDTNALFAIDIDANLFSLGRCWEDGEDLVHYAYSLQVEELATGRRWAHDKVFRMTHDCSGPSACSENEDGCNVKQEFHSDDAALKACEALAAKVQAAYKSGSWKGPFNEHWYEVDAAYGSQAYHDQGVEAREAFLERREAGLDH